MLPFGIDPRRFTAGNLHFIFLIFGCMKKPLPHFCGSSSFLHNSAA